MHQEIFTTQYVDNDGTLVTDSWTEIAIFMFEVKGKNSRVSIQYSRCYKRLQDFLHKFLKLTIQHGFLVMANQKARS